MTPTALTIAGSDSGGGAGIQADLKTFAAFGVFGTSAITALTAQNTLGVRRWEAVAPELVRDQIEAVLEDIGAGAVKTGMLANAGIVRVVADCLRRYGAPLLVVDPVMIAKGGAALLEPEAQEVLRAELLPLAVCVTPNLPEAAALLGVADIAPDEMEPAGRELLRLGPRSVLVKGGHAGGGDQEWSPHDTGEWSPHEVARDVLVCADGETVVLEARRVPGDVHGTGCTLSAAIAAGLATGLDLVAAVQRAKEYLTAALANPLAVGKGHGVLRH